MCQCYWIKSLFTYVFITYFSNIAWHLLPSEAINFEEKKHRFTLAWCFGLICAGRTGSEWAWLFFVRAFQQLVVRGRCLPWITWLLSHVFPLHLVTVALNGSQWHNVLNLLNYRMCWFIISYLYLFWYRSTSM